MPGGLPGGLPGEDGLPGESSFPFEMPSIPSAEPFAPGGLPGIFEPPAETPAEQPAEQPAEPSAQEPNVQPPFLPEPGLQPPGSESPSPTKPAQPEMPPLRTPSPLDPGGVDPLPGMRDDEAQRRSLVPQPLAADSEREPAVPMVNLPLSPPRNLVGKGQASKGNWLSAVNPGFRGDMALKPAGDSSGGAAQTKATEASAAVHESLIEGKKGSSSTPDATRTSLSQPAVFGGRTSFKTQTAVLDGYCPVELVDHERWTEGDPRWTVVYGGCTYTLSTATARERFRANPSRYVAVNSGNDPVLTVDQRRATAGRTDFCVTYDGRLFMFAREETLQKFLKDPRRYLKVVAK